MKCLNCGNETNLYLCNECNKNYVIENVIEKIFPYKKETSPLPLPIILDGDIQEDTLKHLKKDKKWVYNFLDKKNIRLQDVFFAFFKVSFLKHLDSCFSTLIRVLIVKVNNLFCCRLQVELL